MNATWCFVLIFLTAFPTIQAVFKEETQHIEQLKDDLFIVEAIDINENENFTHPNAIDLHSLHIYDSKLDTKIIGGFEAKPNQFPYQVAIYVFGRSGRILFCGGSVISTEYVITAAHCIFERPRRILVIMGTTRLRKYNKNEVRRDVERFIIHKNFDRESLNHDICLLQLRGSIAYTKAIAPIALPNMSDIHRNYLNRVATVSGFGKTVDGGDSSTRLMFIELDVMDNQICNRWFDDRDATHCNICTSGMYGTGACQGDSGGPLVIDNKLIGLVSYGARYCSMGYPSVYTRVPCYIKWIASYTNIPIH